MTTYLLIVIVGLLLLIAWLCLRVSRLHLKASMLSQTIAEMLDDPPNMLDIAVRNRKALEDAGLWSGPVSRGGPGEGTWRCHVCDDERPDAKISVYSDSRPVAGGRATMTVNVRYCNDRKSCIDGAPGVATKMLNRDEEEQF